MDIKVTYLLNSGFALEIEDKLLVFDYYQDPKDVVTKLAKEYNNIYFFASHIHFDHFNPAIFNYYDEKKNVKYILSYDIKVDKKIDMPIYTMDEYDDLKLDDLKIKSYSSTDEGISFYIEIKGKKIFHAGDFNWWHWKEDTENNILFARNGFKKQMKILAGLEFDLVFFPVDSRLCEYMDLGIKYFCEKCKVKNIVAMHNVGGKTWQIPYDDFKDTKEFFVPDKIGVSYNFSL